MNQVDRAKTRIWVLQVELRSNLNETEANFKLEEAVSLSTALPELELAGSQVVKISSFNPSAIFTKQKQNELHHLIAFNNGVSPDTAGTLMWAPYLINNFKID
mgnify:CR=1 FL=1